MIKLLKDTLKDYKFTFNGKEIDKSVACTGIYPGMVYFYVLLKNMVNNPFDFHLDEYSNYLGIKKPGKTELMRLRSMGLLDYGDENALVNIQEREGFIFVCNEGGYKNITSLGVYVDDFSKVSDLALWTEKILKNFKLVGDDNTIKLDELSDKAFQLIKRYSPQILMQTFENLPEEWRFKIMEAVKKAKAEVEAAALANKTKSQNQQTPD